jgi:hypothetical protein
LAAKGNFFDTASWAREIQRKMEDMRASQRGFTNAMRRVRRMANRKFLNIVDSSSKAKKRTVSARESLVENSAYLEHSSTKRPCHVKMPANYSFILDFDGLSTKIKNRHTPVSEGRVSNESYSDLPSPTEPRGPTSCIPFPNVFSSENTPTHASSSLPLHGMNALIDGISSTSAIVATATASSTPRGGLIGLHRGASSFPAPPAAASSTSAFLQGAAWAAAMLGPAAAGVPVQPPQLQLHQQQQPSPPCLPPLWTLLHGAGPLAIGPFGSAGRPQRPVGPAAVGFDYWQPQPPQPPTLSQHQPVHGVLYGMPHEVSHGALPLEVLLAAAAAAAATRGGSAGGH